MQARAMVLGAVLGLTTFGFHTSVVLAHGDEAHEPVTQSQAEHNASETLARFVAAGKLDQSWKGVAVANAEQKEFGGHKEWVVSFKNVNANDPAKQTLYVFMNLGGEYLAANFTGK